MRELRFMECDPCKAKPGSPVLCESCLNNRAVIMRQQEALSRLGSAASFIKKLIGELTLLMNVQELLEYPKGCICKKPWFENINCKVHGR